jgi:hypothetical protein
VRMTWAGPKSAFSNVGSATGVPSQTNLGNISPVGASWIVGLPNQSRDSFEAVLVELWITRVLADLSHDIDQPGQDALVNRRERLPCGNDHPHDTWR